MIAAALPPGGDGDTPETCRRCDLWEKATQVVVGEGPRRAPLMLVGEQPGDEEDRMGRPFVGPAGRLLRLLLGEAGIDPAAAFVTNAVKHFSFELRGIVRVLRCGFSLELSILFALPITLDFQLLDLRGAREVCTLN